MRLNSEQIKAIREIVARRAGAGACVRVFGSRLRDDVRGGDLDMLVELPVPVENPALLSAQIAVEVGRCMHGRNVDVVLSAPNLERLPIHALAEKEGVML